MDTKNGATSSGAADQTSPPRSSGRTPPKGVLRPRTGRLWRAALAVGIGLMAVGGGVLLLVAPAPRSDVEGSPVLVVTQNLGDVIAPRPSVAEVIDVFAAMPEADVYLLQEVAGSRGATAIADSLGNRPGEYRAMYSGRAGVSIITRLPVIQWAAMEGASAVQALLRLEDGSTVRAVSLHLPAFRKPRDGAGDARIGPVYGVLRVTRELFTENARSRSLTRILAWLEETAPLEFSHIPTIVGGDFNTLPATLAPRRMRPKFRDSLWRSGDYWTSTYQRIAGPLGARVDFLFHSPDIGVADAWVYERTAGDHFPVFAEYQIPSR